MDTFIETFIMNFKDCFRFNFKEFLSPENHKDSINLCARFFGMRGHLSNLRRSKTRDSCCFIAYCERFADSSI